MYFFPLLSSKSSIKAFLAKLSNILGKNIEEDEDNDLLEFE